MAIHPVNSRNLSVPLAKVFLGKKTKFLPSRSWIVMVP